METSKENPDMGKVKSLLEKIDKASNEGLNFEGMDEEQKEIYTGSLRTFTDYFHSFFRTVLSGDLKQAFSSYKHAILLFASLQNKEIVLCDVPGIFFRTFIGNIVAYDALLAIFKNLMKMVKDEKENINLSSATKVFLLENYNLYRDVYLTCIINQVLGDPENQGKKVGIYLEMPHYYSLIDFSHTEMADLPWEEVFKMPKLMYEEDENTLIKKHALLDVMFETDIWVNEELHQRFPYIPGFTNLTESDSQELKKKFYVEKRIFEGVVKEVYKQFDNESETEDENQTL